MDSRFRVLDCTLRDGGHIVNGRFDKNVFKITKFSLMTDFINLDYLEPYDGTIVDFRLRDGD